MSFHIQKSGDLEYLRADALNGCIHGFSTRLGGVSEGHLSSLNLGTHRGDSRENVLENYRLFGAAAGFRPETLVFTKQEHTNIIRKVTKADCGYGLEREADYIADGLITNEPGVTLVCFSADCTPILLFDPVQHAVAAVHSGWRGTAMGIVKTAVETMCREYSCRPSDIRAAIGPCISKCCFEVGPEVPQAMLESLGEDARAAIEARGEKFHVDLKECNRLWLQKAGVETVDISTDCTKCQPNRFWSHRITGQARGSLAAVICLREDSV